MKTLRKIIQEAKDIEEEVAGTSSGAGQIAGLGSTSEGKPSNFAEPPVSHKNRYKGKNEKQTAIIGNMLRRRLQT